jgi:aquaporin Z
VRRWPDHLPEYAIEAVLLGTFMVSACAFGVLLEHPASPLHRALPDPFLRRALMGVAMGLTAVTLIYSPWGGRSGAHFNPSVTFTFWRLGRISGPDAVGYMAGQFAGGVAGVLLASVLLGQRLAHPAVDFVATRPGMHGVAVAFVAEVVISALVMTTVVGLTGTRITRWTGLVCGSLVALFITFEAPLSGMSMNPARSFASAAGAGMWEVLWLYFVAPPLGMGLGAWLATRLKAPTACPKLHHPESQRCIFCGHRPPATVATGRAIEI